MKGPWIAYFASSSRNSLVDLHRPANAVGLFWPDTPADRSGRILPRLRAIRDQNLQIGQLSPKGLLTAHSFTGGAVRVSAARMSRIGAVAPHALGQDDWPELYRFSRIASFRVTAALGFNSTQRQSSGRTNDVEHVAGFVGHGAPVGRFLAGSGNGGRHGIGCTRRFKLVAARQQGIVIGPPCRFRERAGGENLRRLVARYPRYNAQVADFIAHDPPAAIRARVAARLGVAAP